MNQTVFRFPPLELKLRVARDIRSGEKERGIMRAYRRLSDYYGVIPPSSVIISPDVLYRTFKEEFLEVAAFYSKSDMKIVFKTESIALNEETVVHEFYHHLEHIFGINGEGKGPTQTAHSFARLFWEGVFETPYAWLFDPDWDNETREKVKVIHAFIQGVDRETGKELKRRNYLPNSVVYFDRSRGEYVVTWAGKRVYRMAKRILRMKLPSNAMVMIEERGRP